MNIWIDIATAPQVLMFRPLIEELRRKRHTLVITTRNSTETVALADSYGLQHTAVGVHGGKTTAGKVAATCTRAVHLIWHLRGRGLDLAVSGSSYSQALAAAMMRLPMVALNDYEGNPGMHIVCRVAQRILVPGAFCKENLCRFGANLSRIQSYDGLKESIYLSDFEPDLDFRKRAGFPEQGLLVTMRPASEVAAYHQFENRLFDRLLVHIARHPQVTVMVLPRTKEQRRRFESLSLPHVLFPTKVLDGPNLIYHSDLVVGGGGTMNREAVVLGTPAYTLFKGTTLGSVDKWLIESGQLVQVKDESDFSKVRLCRNPRQPAAVRRREGDALIQDIGEKILRPLSGH